MQNSWNSHTTLRKIYKIAALTGLSIKFYYEATVMKNSVLLAQRETKRSMKHGEFRN